MGDHEPGESVPEAVTARQSVAILGCWPVLRCVRLRERVLGGRSKGLPRCSGNCTRHQDPGPPKADDIRHTASLGLPDESPSRGSPLRKMLNSCAERSCCFEAVVVAIEAERLCSTCWSTPPDKRYPGRSASSVVRLHGYVTWCR